MRTPEPFGNYVLLDRISVGGMAEVFKGKMFAADGAARSVAIKKILPHLAEDRRFVEMFIAEAKMAMQLNHANIAQTLELGRHGEDHFIAMEYISGRDLLALHNHFRRTKSLMPTHLVAYVAARVAEGLHYAHRKKDARGEPLGIIHRDISPQNVLISFEGAVKLIDFGIAKAHKRSYEATRAGVLKGKFGYMSPEQVGKGEVDQRSDIFALGTVIHELLTGKRLFLGDNDFATLDLVREAKIPPPSSLNPEVHPELDRILLKALAKEPSARYQTSGEMAEDFERFLHATGNSLSRKPLADWMEANFAPEIAKEQEKERMAAGIYLEDGRVCYMEIEDDEDDTSLWDGHEARASGWVEVDTAKEQLLSEAAIEAANHESLAEELFGAPTPADPIPLQSMHVPAPQPMRVAPLQPQAPLGPPLAVEHPSLNAPLNVPLDAPLNARPTENRHQVGYGAPAGNRITKRQVIFTIAVLFMVVVCAVFASSAMQEEEVKPTGIVIQVEPREGISIYINGRLVSEQSPYVEKEMAPAQYKIVIEKPGFQNWMKHLDLEEGTVEKLEAKLTSESTIPAKLKLRIYPTNAKLKINGEVINENPNDKIYEFKGGEEVLFELTALGFEPLSKKITAQANSEEVIDLHMIATSGTLFVDSTPPGTVYLNGKRVGRAPYRAENLDISQAWKVRVSRKGYKDLEETIEFGTRRFVQIDGELKR